MFQESLLNKFVSTLSIEKNEFFEEFYLQLGQEPWPPLAI
jgi:hypothetical protein